MLSPDHYRSFGMLDDDQAIEVLHRAARPDRAHLAAGHRHVQVFINHGKEAGASLAHPHAQVVALDFVPPAVEAALARFAAAGTDLVDRQIAEVDGGPLAVSGGPAPAWCPHASGSPYEIRIAHRAARAGFDDATDDEIAAVAIALRDALARLAATVGDVAVQRDPALRAASTPGAGRSTGTSRSCPASASSPGSSWAPACS